MVAPGGGCLTAPDPEAFAAALARLLDDPAAARAMGETARRFAVAERSTEAFEQRLRQGLARLDLA
jgi:glycosyltransferase involved in cell wall biosynthesis